MEDQKSNDNVGIVSMQCYFPKLYVEQEEFEEYNQVSKGKYTIGLGQKQMAFVTDREDICSISLTVLSRLITRNIASGTLSSYNDIGWICVATETILDHSKSISSMLMQLFESNGNTSIEGIDVKHACYAGTFALFSAFDRVSSKYWDGRYCVVIAADIAEYAQGPARCTGGCGAVAMLIGKNGCIELEQLRSSFKAHQYDFYKPNLNSPYPVVNGHVSNACYMNAVDSCCQGYVAKLENSNCSKMHRTGDTCAVQKNERDVVTLTQMMDYWVFHSPYNKIVQKSFGRIMYNDFLNNKQFYLQKYKDDEKVHSVLLKYAQMPSTDTTDSREVIKTFETMSKALYREKVAPSAYIPQRIGNCYTASIFMGLISLIHASRDDLEGKLLNKKIALFSYGSGTLASLYTLKVGNTQHALDRLQEMCSHNDVEAMLQQRSKVECRRFTQILEKRDAMHNLPANADGDTFPESEVAEALADDTYYLTKIDGNKQRFYEKFVARKVCADERREAEAVTEDSKAASEENPYLDAQLIADLNKEVTQSSSFKEFDPEQLQKAVDGVIAKAPSCYY